MYSTKTIEKILISSLQENRVNKKPVVADSLNNNTHNQYQYIEDIDEIKEVLARPEYSQAVEAYKNGHRIYRGQKRQEEHLAALVTPGIRRSKDGSNFYTRLMSDILPSWNEYPKRNKSAICANVPEITEDYVINYPFVIFPRNNTKIGICALWDIWYSFPFLEEKTNCNLDVFTRTVIQFLSFVIHETEWSINQTFLADSTENIVSLFRLAEIICQTKISKSEFENLLNNNDILFPETHLELYNKAKQGKLLQYFSYLLNPEKNNFKLVTINEVPKNNQHELWFEGQHLMIREDVVNEIFEN